jgi:hypothetical protein
MKPVDRLFARRLAFVAAFYRFVREPCLTSLQQKPTYTMAAISMPIAARAEYALHQLAKRNKNWAQREPGVIVVFVIVFLVFILVIAMFINKRVCRLELRYIALFLTTVAEASRQARRRINIRYPESIRSEERTREDGRRDVMRCQITKLYVGWARACV